MGSKKSKAPKTYDILGLDEDSLKLLGRFTVIQFHRHSMKYMRLVNRLAKLEAKQTDETENEHKIRLNNIRAEHKRKKPLIRELKRFHNALNSLVAAGFEPYNELHRTSNQTPKLLGSLALAKQAGLEFETEALYHPMDDNAEAPQ